MRFGCAAIFLAMGIALSAGAADNERQSVGACPLIPLAKLDMLPDAGGRILIPVEVDGNRLFFLLDTGSPVSVLTPAAAARLHLALRPALLRRFLNIQGRYIKTETSVKTFAIGSWQSLGVHMLVSPGPLDPQGRFDGLLGADFLARTDLEINFKAGYVDFYAPPQCSNAVVPWPTSVPGIALHIRAAGYIYMPMMLDGKKVSALLDTGTNRTLLDVDVAQDVFGLEIGGEETPAANVIMAGQRHVFQHVFQSLTLDALQVGPVPVLIFQDQAKSQIKSYHETGYMIHGVNEAGGLSDMILGSDELSRFRIFISYKHEMLYATEP